MPPVDRYREWRIHFRSEFSGWVGLPIGADQPGIAVGCGKDVDLFACRRQTMLYLMDSKNNMSDARE